MNKEMNFSIVENLTNVGNSPLLQFSRIIINEDYRKKWNIYNENFICLTKNGELIRNTLYRIGGMGTPNLNKDKYFMLLKYVEAFYSEEIMKHSTNKDNKHLEGLWCILDENGNEIKTFDSILHSPYLIKNSVIYSHNSNYYNVVTDKLYCQSFDSMESTEFLFLDNKFDNDISKQGVMKINKKDGSWELFH